MAASYREIDYRIRLGKYAERVMMVDAFRRLKFATPNSYQYVGLGSVYFSDFSLVHRTLGITNMVSIERNEYDKNRFIDNIPFRCIEMRWGDTATELSKIDFRLRSITWLDYDGRLSRAILNDITDVTARAVSGSVLAVTVQSRFDRATGDDGSDRSVHALVDTLGADRVPHDLSTKELMGKGTSKLFRNVVFNEIERAIESRNATLPHGQRMKFSQIFNFRYEDGVLMTTVGVVFFDVGQQGLFEMCGFQDLEFVRPGEEAFEISIPKLTPSEVKRLEAQMPIGNSLPLSIGSIPKGDADKYACLYRYFPSVAFVEP